MKYSESNIDKKILRALEKMEFVDMTPIQEMAIPVLQEGLDIIGQAQTGTGKTAAFGIPMIEALLKYGHEVTIATRGLQKDPFENRVQRIIADRQNIEDLKKIFEDNHYDLVIDKIAYASNDIKRLLDVISCDRYMLMSTTAVYEYVDTFDPYHDDYLYVNRNDDSYRITKRYAECALAQDYPQIPSVVVRYPFVVGLDDYTKRIQFYINHILLEKSMYIDNLNTPLHFIDSQEAGEFMAFLANENITGIFDGASVGTITIKEMIEIINILFMIKAIIEDAIIIFLVLVGF